MANHFKDYRAGLKENKKTVLSEDELNRYSQTAKNEGATHKHPEWLNDSGNGGNKNFEDVTMSEKEKDVQRDIDREFKIKNKE